MRKKTWTNEQFIEAVNNNKSRAGVLKELGLKPIGGNYKTVNSNIDILGLDTSHWTGQGHLKGKNHNWSKKREFSDILVKNSDYLNTTNLKRRLINENLLDNKCVSCGLCDKWNGEEITLQLDHINGESTDNRLENLRILCPNCHSQTKTFTGRNIKNQREIEKNKCIDCDTPTKYYNSKRCLPCSYKARGK